MIISATLTCHHPRYENLVSICTHAEEACRLYLIHGCNICLGLELVLDFRTILGDSQRDYRRVL